MITPTSPAVDELESHLQQSLRGRVFGLQVEVHDSGLILRGHTYSFHGKQLAQAAAMAATELPILANEIEVF